MERRASHETAHQAFITSQTEHVLASNFFRQLRTFFSGGTSAHGGFKHFLNWTLKDLLGRGDTEKLEMDTYSILAFLLHAAG